VHFDVRAGPLLLASLQRNAPRARPSSVAAVSIAPTRPMLQVMDNHYVPNLTIGPMVCKALRNYGITAPIDVSLLRGV
jgi:hypothetical protein